MTQALPKVCVVLGAGASYDVHSAGSRLRSGGLRPPLARELFNLEQRNDFRTILEEYPGAVVLAQSLASKSGSSDFDLEQELRTIAEHPDARIREHYKHVPPYLRDLLTMCSYGYTEHPSCYVQLVRALLAEESSDALFLVLNYDDLLEQALYLFTGGDIRFESMEDYVRPNRSVKVVKLHGSITWFKLIGAGADWRTLVRNKDVLAKPEENEIYVAARNGRADQARTYQIEITGNRGYPVLTAPLAGKGATASVCPATHLAAAKEFLGGCNRFLIIGSSGLDDDLLALLSESVRTYSPSPWVQVVSGSEAEGEKVWQRFAAGVRAFRSLTSREGRVAFDGGFQAYVTSDALIGFLRASI